ncbi:hypothetical protein QYF61_021981, partial [Mycteria americana]
MLAGPDHLGVLYVPCDGTQDGLRHKLPRHQECPAFLDSFALQDCFPRDSVCQASKQAKVCPPEVQGGSSADPPPYFSKNQKLYHFVIAMPKTASNHDISCQSFPVHKQQLQQGTFPSWLAHQLCLEGWQLNHFPGQPVPMLDNPFSEVKFPNIQSKPPLAQLEAISSHPITCYLGEDTDPHLSTTSFQVVVESDKVSPQPPFLQAKQSQFPQPILIRLLLQTLHQLRCPSLDSLQHLNVPLVVRGPKLNTVFEVRPHQCRVQGHDHFTTPAGHAIFDTSQDAIGFLGHLGTLLAHIQPAVDQYPQVLFHRAAFQPLFPKTVALHGVAVAQ